MERLRIALSTSPGRGIRRAALSVPLLLLTACGSRSPAARATEEAQTVASWAATTHLVADRWLARAVPDAYARHSLETVRKTLAREATKAASDELPAEMRGPIRAAIEAVDRSAAAVYAAVERHDRTAVAEQIGRLAEVQRSLAPLVERGGAS
jgi:hypothetical protein